MGIFQIAILKIIVQDLFSFGQSHFKGESFKTKYLGISISIENFKFPLTLVDLKFLYFFSLVSLVEMKVSSILCLEMQNESILVKAVQIRMPLLVSVESSKKTIILCFLGLLITGDILTV